MNRYVSKLLSEFRKKDAKAKIRVLNYLLTLTVIIGFWVVGQTTKNPTNQAWGSIIKIAHLPLWTTSTDNNNNANCSYVKQNDTGTSTADPDTTSGTLSRDTSHSWTSSSVNCSGTANTSGVTFSLGVDGNASGEKTQKWQWESIPPGLTCSPAPGATYDVLFKLTGNSLAVDGSATNGGFCLSAMTASSSASASGNSNGTVSGGGLDTSASINGSATHNTTGSVSITKDGVAVSAGSQGNGTYSGTVNYDKTATINGSTSGGTITLFTSHACSANISMNGTSCLLGSANTSADADATAGADAVLSNLVEN